MARKKEWRNGAKDLKLLIVKRLKSLISQRKAAQTIAYAQSTVREIWKKYRSSNDVKNLPRSGRPRATSSRQDRKLVNLAKSMRSCTSKQLNAEWSKYRVKVCARTVRNRLNDKRYHFCKAKTKPYMTIKHKKSRLQWCKKHKSWSFDDWKKVIFSDESRICLGTGDGTGIFVWRRADEKFKEDCLKTKTKYQRSFMVWSCMTSQRVGKLCIVLRTINSEVYIDILEHYLIPSIEEAFGDSSDFIFQDDNASCHRSKKVKNFFNRNGNSPIKTMNCPANSPDLNPIENVWNVLKRNIDKRRPTNMDELRLAIKESWGEIPSNLCHELVESMPRHLNAVIKAKGGPTKY